MKKYWFIPLLGLAAVILGLWVVFAEPNTPPETDGNNTGEVHYHAGFQIYVDDVLQDFSDLIYMETKPCGPGDHDDSGEADDTHEENERTVHLHNGIPDVVHIHAAGHTWRDVAEYLNEMGGHGLTEDMLGGLKIETYVDGVQVNDLASRAVEPYQSVVVLVGDNTDIEAKLAGRVTREHIIVQENSLEGCGTGS